MEKIEIGEVKKIETTHADLSAKSSKKEKKKDEVLYKPPTKQAKKVDSKIVSVRFRADELDKINNYLAENGIRFSELIRELLREKGIL